MIFNAIREFPSLEMNFNETIFSEDFVRTREDHELRQLFQKFLRPMFDEFHLDTKKKEKLISLSIN